MKKMVYDEAEIKRFTAPMEEPMRHQIQDAMNLKIPKEYIQVLVNKKFNFYSRAYLIGCILDQESLEGIQQLAKKESAEEMCLERRKLQEKTFLQESPVFREYKKMAEVYKEQIERVKRDQQQYQDTLRFLNEINVKREKEEPGETEVQKNPVDQKDTFLEDENKKLRSLIIQLEYDLQEVKEKLTVASQALQKEQKEKEQLQRRLRFMSGVLSESEMVDQEETSLVVWNGKQAEDGLLIFKPVNQLVCYLKRRKRRREEKDRRAFMTGFVKRKSSEPDQVDFLMELYREGWRMEELKKISECEQIDEMKQRKENIERARSYQKMLEREMKQ